MNLSRRGMVGVTLAGIAALASGCGRGRAVMDGEPNEGAELRSTFFAFNTVCVIGGIIAREVLDAAVSRCLGFEQRLSRTIATSDVARINAAAGATTVVDASTAELIDAALGFRTASDGVFDITIGAVSELWDFAEGVIASERAIADALPHVGADVDVDLTASTVTLADPDARIDLGGIAKGYVADAAIALLADAGVPSAYVNLGGNVAVLGTKPDGSPWSVGVRNPFADIPKATDAADDATDDALVAHIDVVDGSVVTSGLYERSFVADGHRFWHILDPRTGYPVDTDLASVSVAATRSIDADGNSKTPFFLGAKAGLAFLTDRGLQGLVVTTAGDVLATPGSDFVVGG